MSGVNTETSPLLNIINIEGSEAECLLSMFVEDTKLGGVPESLEGHTAMQRDLCRLEKSANRILMKTKALHLRRNNPRYQDMLEATQLGRSPTEQDLRVLVDTKLNVSLQCSFSVK